MDDKQLLDYKPVVAVMVAAEDLPYHMVMVFDHYLKMIIVAVVVDDMGDPNDHQQQPMSILIVRRIMDDL